MLSIIIPAYNEEEVIESTVKDYYDTFSKANIDFEIIIIPNNCSDSTVKLAESLANDKIKVFWYKSHTIGKGQAVKVGFEKATGDYVGFVDADNSVKPEEFFKIYKKVKDYDCVISSRKIKGAKIEPRRRINQWISSWFFNKAVKLIVGLKFYDTQCGGKIFKRKVIDKILEYKDIEKGWAFDVDLLNVCLKEKFTIYEFPINWTDYKSSKLTFRAGITSVLNLFKISKRFKNEL